jgi:DNA-binding MarR family transcriptional regulator
VAQLYDTALAPCGLRATQRSILTHIDQNGRPTIGELAAALVLDRSALAHNLRPLERDDLVVVEVSAEDRRSRIVRLTKAGEAKLRESTALWQSAQERFENAFGRKHAAALRATLSLITSTEF